MVSRGLRSPYYCNYCQICCFVPLLGCSWTYPTKPVSLTLNRHVIDIYYSTFNTIQWYCDVNTHNAVVRQHFMRNHGETKWIIIRKSIIRYKKETIDDREQKQIKNIHVHKRNEHLHSIHRDSRPSYPARNRTRYVFVTGKCAVKASCDQYRNVSMLYILKTVHMNAVWL